jgi:tetratricopeptide (TPR) repeat protein
MHSPEELLQNGKQFLLAGQLEAAQLLLRQVADLQPTLAEAFHLLGGIAVQTGDFFQAIACFQKTAELLPAHAPAWNNLACTYLQVGNFEEAAAASARALQERPDYAEAFYNLGLAREQLGQAAQAQDCYEQAIRLKPAFAAAHLQLGKALMLRREPAAAALAFEQVCRLQPSNAQTAYLLGVAQESADDLKQAAAAFRRALAIEPAFADACFALGTVLEQQGAFAEAATRFREALRIQPDHAWAYHKLSNLAAEQRYEFTSEELRRLDEMVITGRGSVREQGVRSFALASVREGQAAYDKAFALYRHANELIAQELRDLGQAFDAERHRAEVDRIIATFDESYFRRVEGWGRETTLPVFILGVPRSGTTLVEQILTSHPHVFGAGEMPNDMPRTMRALADSAGSDDPERPRPLPSQAISQDMAAGYLARLERLAGAARRVTIKTLQNHLYLGVLATLFPRTRVLYCRRDLLDVGVSLYCHHFPEFAFSWSLEDIGFYCRQYERLMEYWRRALPLPIREVRYEDLIASPERISRDLVSFCGLEWDERCLAFYRNPRPVRTASLVQVRRPLSSKSVGRWKNYARFLEPLTQALGLAPLGDAAQPRSSSTFSHPVADLRI